MEQKFYESLEKARQEAQKLGVRIRPFSPEEAVKQAKRCLSGHRESDGFFQLADMGRLELSLEALACKKQFTSLFTDEEVNNALMRLLDAGYSFR